MNALTPKTLREPDLRRRLRSMYEDLIGHDAPETVTYLLSALATIDAMQAELERGILEREGLVALLKDCDPTVAMLDDAQAQALIEARIRKAGGNTALARELGVSHGYISNIRWGVQNRRGLMKRFGYQEVRMYRRTDGA